MVAHLTPVYTLDATTILNFLLHLDCYMNLHCMRLTNISQQFLSHPFYNLPCHLAHMPVVMSSLSTFTVCMHSRLLYISLPIEHALPGRNDNASIARNYGVITRKLRSSENARTFTPRPLFHDTQRANSRARGVKGHWRDGANRKDHFRAKLGMFAYFAVQARKKCRVHFVGLRTYSNAIWAKLREPLRPGYC